MISEEIIGFDIDSKKGEFVLYIPRHEKTFGFPSLRLGDSYRDIRIGYPNDNGVELASGRYRHELGFFMLENVKPADTPYRSYIDGVLRTVFTPSQNESPVSQPPEYGKDVSLVALAAAGAVVVGGAVGIGLLNGKNVKK
ncbi:MAG: hypothetical protein HY831_03830 [Candidatus Aenigmarchaeota archaeon]|nr:hypothetical protein [Candidatus Aenigmarchaeota archaeon]